MAEQYESCESIMPLMSSHGASAALAASMTALLFAALQMFKSLMSRDQRQSSVSMGTIFDVAMMQRFFLSNFFLELDPLQVEEFHIHSNPIEFQKALQAHGFSFCC